MYDGAVIIHGMRPSQFRTSSSNFRRARTVLCSIGVISTWLIGIWTMKPWSASSLSASIDSFRTGASTPSNNSNKSQCDSATFTDLKWHAPAQSDINNLSTAVNGTGIYGYVFNTSTTPSDQPFHTYNWCNMPHVRSEEYIVPDAGFKLEYVELIHRHHKRTPYASNTFPKEAHSWLCDGQSLFYYATPADSLAAQIAWSITPSPFSPFQGPMPGFPNSTCQFPQITSEGLLDSRAHGSDLRSVYIDKLNFLPSSFDPSKIQFRVTNNQITSQVASQVAIGLYPSLADNHLQVIVQPSGIDSLEPQYPCPAATSLFQSYGVGSNASSWLAHLSDPSTISLFNSLDSISGVNSSSDNKDWHTWFDHYFDNLSAKLCHAKPLPCRLNATTSCSSHCVTREMADVVFRLGLFEYSYIYRDNPLSLSASTASFGVWMAELAHNLRQAVHGTDQVKYRHNIAHDGSLSRLLSILQIDVMVWPGMGSEVVFELWRKRRSGCWFVRVLWKGEILMSSNPALGRMDMVPVQSLLDYIDALVGVGANKVPGLCKL